MPSPKDSVWYDTPEAARHRKHLKLTLPVAALERLERMAKARKASRSAVVEELILSAPIKAGGT